MSSIKTSFKTFVNEELNKVQEQPQKSKIIYINEIPFEINENNIKIDDKNCILTITLVDVNNKNNQSVISIKYAGSIPNVIGIDGIENEEDATKIFNVIENFININKTKYQSLQKLSNLKIEQLYKN